jgi:hypothetical protein
VKPVFDTDPNPLNGTSFAACACSCATGTPADALADEPKLQSAASIGQFEASYHSATKLFPSAFVFAGTNTRNDAPVTVASSGNADVSNRTNPAITE